MQYEQIDSTLKSHIQAGLTQQAIAFVTSAQGYHEGEIMVAVALAIENCPQEVIDAALERFVATRENRYEKHGYWVHSLSHFTSRLWKRGDQKSWIKRLNEIAFTGANELGDSNCSDRLVGDFVNNALWNSVPAEYGYTAENLRWTGDGDEYSAYSLALIKALPFKSEADFIKFELKWPKRFIRFDCDSQSNLVNGEKFQTAFNRLKELGVEVPEEMSGMLKCMLQTSLEEHEAALKNANKDWQIERATKAIDKTKAMLASVTTYHRLHYTF